MAGVGVIGGGKVHLGQSDGVPSTTSSIACVSDVANMENPIRTRQTAESEIRHFESGDVNAGLPMEPGGLRSVQAAQIPEQLSQPSSEAISQLMRQGELHAQSIALAGRASSTVASVPPADNSGGKNNCQAFPKWKPSDRFILCMDESDPIIRNTAKVQIVARDVPYKNCFHLNSRPIEAGNPVGTLLHDQAFSRLTQAQRLEVHSHGEADDVNFNSPAQLAALLEQSGLREVGVLKFQSCYAGKGDYLERLRDELTARNIRVGYLSGPTGAVAEQRHVFRLLGKRFTIKSWLLARVFDPLYWPALCSRRGVRVSNFLYYPERLALKVVKGNVDVAFPGTRYAGPGEVAATGWAQRRNEPMPLQPVEEHVERRAMRKWAAAGIVTGSLVAGGFILIPFTLRLSAIAAFCGVTVGIGMGVVLLGKSLALFIQSFPASESP